MASRELFLVLQWGGAAYLIGMGLRMAFARAPGRVCAPPAPVARCFVRGFIIQGANPKALLFFMALLPQFIDPTQAIPSQMVALGASSVLIELVALSAYALTASRASRVAGPCLAGALERLGGGVFVAAGTRLALAPSE